MSVRKFTQIAGLAAALTLPLVAAADTKSSKDSKTTVSRKTQTGADELSETELQILAHLHHNDQLEVKAGQLALQKGSSQGVKSFAKMLVDDHGADARSILALVKKQGKSLPDVKPMNDADKLELQMATDTLAKLDSLAGADFDREFLRTQLAMHEKSLTKLDLDIAKIEGNSDLVQMLRGVRPTLIKHADTARTLLGAEAERERVRK